MLITMATAKNKVEMMPHTMPQQRDVPPNVSANFEASLAFTFFFFNNQIVKKKKQTPHSLLSLSLAPRLLQLDCILVLGEQKAFTD